MFIHLMIIIVITTIIIYMYHFLSFAFLVVSILA